MDLLCSKRPYRRLRLAREGAIYPFEDNNLNRREKKEEEEEEEEGEEVEEEGKLRSWSVPQSRTVISDSLIPPLRRLTCLSLVFFPPSG